MATFSVLILTAAPPGQGAEAGGAYVKVDGRESLLRSVELFLNRDLVKQIQLAVIPDAMENAKQKYGGHLGFSGVKLISGGPRWIDQIAVAGEKISPDCSHVLVHDAARPAVAYSDIDAIMAEAPKYPIVALATPSRGLLVEVDEGANPLAFHLPERFMQLLTPQVFKRETFLEMARNKQEIHASKFHLLKGSPLNIRVGGSGDAALAKTMIAHLPRPKLKVADNPFEEAQW